MYMLQILASFVALSGLNGLSDALMNTSCSPGTVYDSLHHNCTCAAATSSTTFRPVSCRYENGEFKVGVFVGYCMTMNNKRSEVVVGPCPSNIKPTQHEIYTKVPSNRSQLDRAVCGYTKRTGQLCGQCANGTSPPVYPYYPQCVDCPAGTNNWAKYLAVSLLPTTLFFIGTVTLRLRATSPNMNGFILLCQIIGSPPVLRLVGNRLYKHNYSPSYVGAVLDVYVSYLSIWNLDFFRTVYSPFCLHPNATTLQVLSLDYITAAYPLVLIILTYTLVSLHYHNCRLVVWLWRPFLRCCICFRRQWNIWNSLVDAFATFLLLSYVKFLSVSIDILAPSFVWNMTSTWQPTVLYYDGSVEYFSKEHLPYAILAITVLLVFTLLPILLLCLYPCRCFQRFLNSCHLRSQALHTFMDAFQGCYKNGTNGTRDCRYFAAVYLITRMALHFSLMIPLVLYTTSLITVPFLGVIVLISVFQPYRKQLYNQLDIFFCLVTVVLLLSSVQFKQDCETRQIEYTNGIILLIFTPLLVLYPLCLLLYHIWRRSIILQSATQWVKAHFSRPNAYRKLEESLPHRVVMEEAAHLLRSK